MINMAVIKVKEWNDERLIYYWSDAPNDLFQIAGMWWAALREVIEEDHGELTKENLEHDIMNVFVNLGKTMQKEMEKKEKDINIMYV